MFKPKGIPFSFVEKLDVLKEAAKGATFLLNAPYEADEVWDKLPRELQQEIIDKDIQFYSINAYDVALKNGMGTRTNTIMQTPIRNYVSMSNGLFTEDMADGLLKVFEGKDVAKGVGKIAKGVPNALVNLKSLLKSI